MFLTQSFCSCIVIVFVSFSLIALWELPQTGAQNLQFVPYENPSLGFSIQHPSNWPLVNDTPANEKQVMFKPLDSVMPMFVIRTANVTRYLDTDTLTVKNKTLDQIVQETITNISHSKSNPLALETKIIRQTNVTVGNNPGVKIEMTMSFDPEGDSDMYAYLYYVLTVANGTLYSLEYDENPLKVPETLPIASKMLDSFQIMSKKPAEKKKGTQLNSLVKEMSKGI